MDVKQPRVADRGVEKKSQSLDGKRIAYAVCGGIASVEAVKGIRELRRHGARVSVFMTPDAAQFVGKMSLEWASGEPVVAEAGADVSHLEGFDAVLVAPATLNTLAKAALGLCDNAVTLLLAGQFGAHRPVLLAPTMNGQLASHPRYAEYRDLLQKWGARFVDAGFEEDRIKMPSHEKIAQAVIEALRGNA